MATVNDSDLPPVLNGPFERIKLAPGVLGYAMYVSGLVLVVLFAGIIARPDLVPWIIGVALLVLAIFVGFAAWFGSKFPMPALLGGAHLVQALGDALAAQGRIIDTDSEPVQNPALPQPAPDKDATDAA